MADGKVEIEVLLDDGSVVKGVADMKGQLQGISPAAEGASVSVGSLIKAFVGLEAVKKVVSAVGDGIKQGFNFNAEVETMKVGWNTILGGGDKAEKMVARLNDYAKKTPFNTSDTDKMGKYLYNAGIEGDKMFKTMTTLGDVTSAYGGSAADAVEVTRQYAQVIQAGTAYTEDLNIMNDRGIPIYQAIAKQMGINVGQVKEMASKGKISSEIYANAVASMGDKVSGAMDKQSQTWTGMVSTFEDSFSQVMGILAKPIFEKAKEGLTSILALLENEKFLAQVEKLGSAIGTGLAMAIDIAVKAFQALGVVLKFLQPILPYVGTAFAAFVATVGLTAGIQKGIAAVKALGVALKAILLGNPIGLIVAGLSVLALGLAKLYKTNSSFKGFVDGIVTSFKNMIKPIDEGGLSIENFKKVLSNITGSGKGVLSFLGNLGKNFLDLFKNIDMGGKSFGNLGKLLAGLVSPFGIVGKAVITLIGAMQSGNIDGLFRSLGLAISQVGTAILTASPLIGQSLANALSGLGTIIGTVLPALIQVGLQIIGGIISGLAQGLPLLATQAATLLYAITTAIYTLMPAITMVGQAVITTFGNAMLTLIPLLISYAGQIIVSIVNGIQVQLPQIITAASNLIVTFLNELNRNLPNIMTAGFNIVITFLEGIAQNLPKVLQLGMEILIEFLQGIANNIGKVTDIAITIIVNFVNAIAGRIGDIVDAAVNLMVNFINGIAGKVDDLVDAIVNLIVAILEAIAGNIHRIVDAGMDIVDALVQGILQMVDRIFQAGITLLNGLADSIRNNTDQIRQAGLNVLDALVRVFVPDALVNVGENLIGGLWNGISNMAQGLMNYVSNLASNIVDTIQSALDIHSPSRVMRDKVGKWIPAGIGVGIEKNADLATSGLDTLATDLSSYRGLTQVVPTASSIMGGTAQPIQPVVHINIEKAQMGSDQDVVQTSEQLGMLTERQLRGRLS